MNITLAISSIATCLTLFGAGIHWYEGHQSDCDDGSGPQIDVFVGHGPASHDRSSSGTDGTPTSCSDPQDP